MRDAVNSSTGINGASQIAAHLAAKKVELEFVVDEGAFVLDGVVPTLDQPTAYICNSEKGFVNVELSVDAVPSAHSSSPPVETSLGILANAVARLERRPHPIRSQLFAKTLCVPRAGRRYRLSSAHWTLTTAASMLLCVWLAEHIRRQHLACRYGW